MGLISFIKNAGEKLFKSEEKREKEKADLITAHIRKFGFDTSNIQVAVDDDKVTLSGTIDTIDNKNKIIVTAGNVDGIAAVEDRIIVKQPVVVAPPPPEKQFYTVKKGDYLSKIAKEVYGNANKYNII
ncbi:MAG TPA: peptidoglycan-binding protein LysM, partial [Bacteroidales bacterium]|nr:peptidoglycan-binding protein LysM [Bacteroidales bacterium]